MVWLNQEEVTLTVNKNCFLRCIFIFFDGKKVSRLIRYFVTPQTFNYFKYSYGIGNAYLSQK